VIAAGLDALATYALRRHASVMTRVERLVLSDLVSIGVPVDQAAERATRRRDLAPSRAERRRRHGHVSRGLRVGVRRAA
jgi:hypothetical protein